MKYSEYSVVIVGSGAAGLYAALKLSQQINLPDGILLLTKGKLGYSNSGYAQGGIVGVLRQNTVDNVDLHVNDTLNAGAGLSDKDVTTYISEMSDTVLNDIIDNGVNFDKDKAGNLNFTLEAAHSCRRILHVGGDATGKGIVDALVKKVKEDSIINVVENSIAVELLTDDKNECKGLVYYNSLTNEHEIVYSSAVVLATGGVGQLYKYTTNPSCATGDGIELAYTAGAEIRNMEFIQFHPTALALSPDSKNRFLISEAVRGEGAKLINNDGSQFMSKYHDKRELAPRDIVTRAIYSEMNKNNIQNVYLDASFIERNKLSSRFPTIFSSCLKNGIDISLKPIPVAPAAHYTMGGIKATVAGKTSINGLYAIGEVASTGLHGANRLASNSLLECVVSAYELADYLSFANLSVPKMIDSKIIATVDKYSAQLSEDDFDIENLKQTLKALMWEYVGIIRDEEKLLYAKNKVADMQKAFTRDRKCLNIAEYEYRNMLTVANLIIESAINRKESRGAHSRNDYPLTSETATDTIITKSNNGDTIYA